MYFVDETTPSMSLTTILVVLVEESDRDNAYVKPIVSTINNQLYEVERKFLETTKAQKRTAKLYHHMQESTLYDIRPVLNEENNTLVRQMTLSDSTRTEDITTAFFEAYEQMEGVNSDLYFLDEDRDYTFTKHNELHTKIDKFNRYEPQDVYYPFDNNCTYVVFYTAIHKVSKVYSVLDPFANNTCEFGTDFIYNGLHKLMSPRVLCRFNMCTMKPPAANATEVDYTFNINKNFAPWVQERNISIEVCEYLVKWSDLIDEGYEDLIFNLTTKHKYQDVQIYIELRKKSVMLNTQLRKYISNYRYYTDFVNKAIPENLMKGLEQLMLDIRKRSGYRTVLRQTDEAIDSERAHQNFPDRKAMRDILHFMKFGNNNYDLKFRRPVVQKGLYVNDLPEHHKKRGYTEYGNLEIPENDVLEDIKRSPRKAIISQAFQISWLIPPDGGYYVYEGSSPLPPCYRAQSVIVFKKPITMSRSQIQALSRIPLSFKKYEDIRSTHPVIHDPEFTVNLQAPPDGEIRFEEVKVSIHFQKRNHLFLGFDGVHKNAVEQSEKFENVVQAGSYKFSAGIRLTKSILLLHFPINIILTLRT